MLSTYAKTANLKQILSSKLCHIIHDDYFYQTKYHSLISAQFYIHYNVAKDPNTIARYYSIFQHLINRNNKFETLKIFIRLLRELNIIDQKKYLVLQTLIQEISRMFGGWIKSLNY